MKAPVSRGRREGSKRENQIDPPGLNCYLGFVNRNLNLNLLLNALLLRRVAVGF
jgi:hypothetical protein